MTITPNQPAPHDCRIASVRVGDTIARADGTRSVVTDAQHYLTAFIGRTADVWCEDGRRYNGVRLDTVIPVIAGPDHACKF